MNKPKSFLGTKLLIALVSISLYSCAQMPYYREDVYYHKLNSPAVKVKLLETRDELLVSPDGSFVIRCYSPIRETSEYFSSAKIWLKIEAGGISLGARGQKEFENNLQKVSFEPRGENFWIYLNGKKYKGIVEIKYLPEEKLALALNTVFMEDYLKGVLPAEIGKWSENEFEALKAQAIASRTYALYFLGNSGEKGYNLESTVADQLYQGADSEDKLTNIAVEKTKGLILTYEGKPIKAHYHANCGGSTERIEDVWEKPPQPYLNAMDDNDFCAWAKNYTWEEKWLSEELEKIISAYLGTYQEIPPGGIGEILNLEILKKSPGGRVSLLEIKTNRMVIRVEKDNIRWVMRRKANPHPILPSTLFDIHLQRNPSGELKEILLKGKGNGHGVGICQTGALGRARAGQSYQEILSYFYQGTKIVKLY